MNLVTNWFKRHFSNPQVVILAVVLTVAAAIVVGFGQMLAPVFAGGILAYLLEWPVARMERLGLPRLLGVVVIFVLFMVVLTLVVFALVPQLISQLTSLVDQVPNYVKQLGESLQKLPQEYPELFSAEEVARISSYIQSQITQFTQDTIKAALASVVDFISVLVYVFLVPVVVFFFLKDKASLIAWVRQFLPRERGLVAQVWADVELQMDNYVRGKALEIVIVGAATYIMLVLFGLSYAALLSVLVGLSVLVPIIGAIVMGIPVALVGFAQFGFSAELAWLCLAYLILQQLDGNVLVPLLFSEVNNLHPVAIITAVLVFGGVWGFWGVFFAIPLATLVSAVIKAWPHDEEDSAVAGQAD
jgi:putative permease